MKKTVYAIFFLTVALAGFKTSIAQESGGKDIPLEYNVEDERFALDNVSFFKRLDNKASNLNVSFDLINKTDADIKLKVFLVAYRRVDAVDEHFRKIVKYPVWRKIDIDKNNQKNILLDSIPPLDKAAVDESYKDKSAFPEFQKYVQYAQANPDKGKDIVIQGFDSNTKSEDGTKEFYVTNMPLKTSVYGKLSVKYNEKNQFFNYLGIVVVDPSEKKVVSSRLFHITKPMKAY